MNVPMRIFLTFSLLAAAARAASVPIDVETLPRHVYAGANGVKITLVSYAEQNWTEVDPTTVFAEKDSAFKEICFEGKFDAYSGQTGIKLVGVRGALQFEDKSKRKAAPEMKSLDNVWICGTLQADASGKGQELLIYDLAKLPPDSQRFENRFLTLERAGNAPGLVELGNRIDAAVKENKSVGMQGYERLSTLRDKSWVTAIALKEKELRPKDPNACYEIAVLYRDLLHRNTQYRAWVLKTLELDPDHGNAGKDAENYFKMVRAGDRWMNREEFDERNRRFEKETVELADKKKRLERESADRREKEIANRANWLLDYQSALRTNDASARVGALTSLGDAIKGSLDLGFGLAAVDILANVSDDSAIINGLDRAAKSEFIEVRQHVYATLAWRASLKDASTQSAYDVLASALRTEHAKEAAQSASDALAANGDKPAIATLIAGLESSDPGVCDALMDGLKKTTHQQLQKREEWMTWWAANKSTTR